jgi:hypothetical protein
MPVDPVQKILDAIAALDKGNSEKLRRRLADKLVEVAETDIDEIRSADPESCLSRLYDFMAILQYKLLEEYKPMKGKRRRRVSRRRSVIAEVLRRRAERIAPTIQALHRGSEIARKIRRKPTITQADIDDIEEMKKEGLTLNEIDKRRDVEPGTTRQLLYRWKKRKRDIRDK